MSVETNQVRVAGSAIPSGESRVGRVVDREEAPAYNDQDRDLVTVDVDGVAIRARADEVEEL